MHTQLLKYSIHNIYTSVLTFIGFLKQNTGLMLHVIANTTSADHFLVIVSIAHVSLRADVSYFQAKPMYNVTEIELASR